MSKAPAQLQLVKNVETSSVLTLFSQFAGSVFEKVRILGETLEFNLMFVKITKDLEVVNNKVRSGYAHLKPKSTVHTYSKYVDKNGVLDTGKYKTYFHGIVQKWLKEMKDTFCITLRNHGVSSQLDFFKDKEAMITKEVWFYVDVVPTFESGKFCLSPFPSIGFQWSPDEYLSFVFFIFRIGADYSITFSFIKY